MFVLSDGWSAREMKYKPKDTPHEMVRLAQGWESLLSQSPNPTAKRYISFVVEYLMVCITWVITLHCIT